MKFYSFFFLLIIFNNLPSVFAQQINLYSITSQRQTLGDNGYTLDGSWMIGARSKLLDPMNFGSNGTYPKSIWIADEFSETNSLASIHSFPLIDILFIGSFNKLEQSLHQFSDEELDSLYSWSKAGGKLIIAPQASSPGAWDFTEFDSRWGFTMKMLTSTFIPTTEGNSSDVFNGPFGQVFYANQGGGAQGYFDTLPSNAIVLAKGYNEKPTLFLDCNTLDLICADVDAFTSLGGISTGSAIINLQDRFWANVITYIDKLDLPAKISENDNQLSTGNYLSYHWLFNGDAIVGATNPNYNATHSGYYSVAVTSKYGCVDTSTIFWHAPIDSASTIPVEDGCGVSVPSAFSPNGDGKNDEFHVLGFGLAKISAFRLDVFNRWGQEVFETTDIAQSWNGTLNGENQSDGVYVYDLEGICSDTGEKIRRAGNVTLIR